MMDTYRQGGAARVYWLTLPAAAQRGGPEIARAVNAAIGVAAQPYRAQVRVLDMGNALHARRALSRRDGRGRPQAR